MSDEHEYTEEEFWLEFELGLERLWVCDTPKAVRDLPDPIYSPAQGYADFLDPTDNF